MRVDASKALVAFTKIQVVLPQAVTKELRKLGDVVRDDARLRIAPISGRSAAALRSRATKTGVVSVDNPLRKTTGFHPEFGPLQMRHGLLPAMEANRERVLLDLEALVSTVIATNT